MGRKDNPGGTQIIVPGDVGWFGNGGPVGGPRDDADAIARRQKVPLTAAAEARLSKLKIDVAGLRQQLAALDRDREALAGKLVRSERDLAELLHHHGLGPAPRLNTDQTEPGTGKTTRNQRRKRAEEKFSNGR